MFLSKVKKLDFKLLILENFISKFKPDYFPNQSIKNSEKIVKAIIHYKKKLSDY
jgi:uncharacterized protein (DUF2164 family)